MKISKNYFLLLGAMFLLGIVNAQTDITPNRYVFADQEPGAFLLIDKLVASANPPNGDTDVTDNWDNGYVSAGNTNMLSGQGDILRSFYQIVDMGGDVGKVLCIKGSSSTFPQGVGGDDGFYLGWWNQSFYTDPNLTPSVAEFKNTGDSEADATAKATVRFKIVFHIHQNEISTTDKLFDILGYTFAGSHKLVNNELSATQEFKSGDFTDVAFNEDTEEEEVTYNSSKWIACEYDYVAQEEDGTPLRFAMRMGAGMDNTTLLIKSITMTVNPTGDAVEREVLTINAGATGIRETIEKSALNFYTRDNNLFLSQVQVGEMITVYSITGQTLHTSVANSSDVTIPLADGVYVVKAGLKTAKVSIN